MSRFTYTAVAADGTKIKDQLDAISESLARDELLGRNLEVQKIKRARKSILSVNITKQRVKRVEIMNFSRQMAAFVAAGIPLTEGLQVIVRSSSNQHWQEVLGEASEAITQGAQFSDALARTRRSLPALLPRDRQGRGDDRTARPRARPGVELSRTRSRDAQQHQPGARVPDGRAGDGRRHRVGARGVGAPEVRHVLQWARRQASVVDAAPDRSREHHQARLVDVPRSRSHWSACR